MHPKHAGWQTAIAAKRAANAATHMHSTARLETHRAALCRRANSALMTDVDRRTVLEERQNFDYSGHYSRPALLELTRK